MSILPTVGRTIHIGTFRKVDGGWTTGTCRLVFVVALDYGRGQRTAIVGRDVTEGDPMPVRIYPDEEAWHYPDQH